MPLIHNLVLKTDGDTMRLIAEAYDAIRRRREELQHEQRREWLRRWAWRLAGDVSKAND